MNGLPGPISPAPIDAAPPEQAASADSRQPLTPSEGALKQAAAWVAAQPLAAAGAASPDGGVLARLREHALQLQKAHGQLGARAQEEVADSFATEWFLDNYYLVRGAIQQTLKDLPRSFWRQLPCLAQGVPEAGMPRVYALAKLLVADCEARLDLEGVEELIVAYQQSAPLTMGELWALPALLRVVIIESLTQSIARISEGLVRAAEGTSEEAPPSVGGRPMAATDDEQVANSIVSLRALQNHDWRAFFERLSLTEQILRGEPEGVYGRMDFTTRDTYRKAVERLAAGSDAPEQAVAEAAVALAAAAAQGAGRASSRQTHVGYYLLAEGRPQLRDRVGYQPSRSEGVRDWLLDHPTPLYLGSVGLATLILLGLALEHVASGGAGVGQQLLLLLVALVPALSIGVGVVNLVLSHSLRPRLLPKLDFSGGVPADCRTAVVVPAMLTSAEGIDSLIRQLEQHYLGNPEQELLFALLSDFADSDQAETERDDELVKRAMTGVEELNRRYGEEARRPFYLFHRQRLWNESEGVWMGWERKRGKLLEFNRLLRGAKDTTYAVQVGDATQLPSVRYVLTLDADTRLPPAAAHRLVGTLAHPLNQAEFDEDGRVVAGYSLLQPRTDILPESANASYYSHLFVGENGLDLYTLAVSDVYQDLFGSGIYVGKGLYQVDDFMRALDGKVPENSILSHDLLEGIYGGVGLVSDVVLYEDYPPNYLAQVLRMQRWIRGDWQLLPWLVGGSGQGKALGAMGSWKIFDNLRRSLLMPSVVLMLLLGWVFLKGLPLVWTLMALGSLLVPLLGTAVVAVVNAVTRRDQPGGSWRGMIPWRPLGDALRRFVITVAFIPFEAVMVVQSVGTTLFRLFVSRKRLLEWRTAAQTERAVGELTLIGTSTRMAGAVLLALAALLLVIFVRPAALWVAWPILLLWLAAPAIAYGISRSLGFEPEELDAEQRRSIHSLARRTWHYFEQFVGPEDNWLPPDNVQTGASPVTAHRTSPTNIGLLLLSTMSAHDLGYLGLVDLSLRLRQTLEVMDRMERYRGHLLNWYDTRSLEPLNPRYVSSVDSGNLVASLIALREGCFELLDQPVEPPRRWGGLSDTIDVLDEIVNDSLGDGSALGELLTEMRDRVDAVVDSPAQWPALFDYLEVQAVAELRRRLVSAIDGGGFTTDEREAARAWAERVGYNVRVTQREFEMLLPWNRALVEAGAWQAGLSPLAAEALADLRSALGQVPTLRQLEQRAKRARGLLEKFRQALTPADPQEAVPWAEDLSNRLTSCASLAHGLMESFESVARLADSQVQGTDFRFLYDTERQLLHIGYNVDTEHLDNNYYDLLASEARLASLVAIATGDLPVKHWLHLGRPLADVGGRATLLSWSGTMFEYLMPTLLTRRFGGTLLEQSCAAAIQGQIDYARRLDVPWGISESGYGRVDAAGTFQYRAFGVPELALDRGQENDLIIAPYASVLAVGFRPQAVLQNLQDLEERGALGAFGLYEALDFTPARKPLGADYKLVSSYMAHHQGMILVSLSNALTDDAMVRRFHSDPRIATVELLLQERIPTMVPVAERPEREKPRQDPIDLGALDQSWRVPTSSASPQAHLLSNGHYSVLITSTGAGASYYEETAITRFSDDPTLEDKGTFIYVRDLDDDALWSATRQPLGVVATEDAAEFAAHSATFTRQTDGVLSRLEVAVADEPAELRRLTLINQSDQPRRLQLTSYAEVVLGDEAGDSRHPAFSKLFVESSFLPDHEALLFRRRPRSASEPALYAAHSLILADDVQLYGDGQLRYETDRLNFLGRGRDDRDPVGPRGPLSNTVGATLDPVMSLSRTIQLAPHSQSILTFVTVYGGTRKELLASLERLRRPGAVQRGFDLARNRSRQELRRGHVGADDLRQFQRLLSALLYPTPALRATPELLAANQLGQSGLWGQGISGDYPILLAHVEQQEELQLIADLVRAHGYWRRRGVKVDVVVLNTKESGYSQELQGRLRWLLSRTGGDDWLDARGGIYLVREDQLAEVDLTLLKSVARVILSAADGPLAGQLDSMARQPDELPLHQPLPGPSAGADALPLQRPTGLQFDNGWGGFTQGGDEYQIYLPGGQLPPAPWSNVAANETVGFLATEGGLGSSWAHNSGENRLTPWRNDPVSDPPAEVVYLRDEESAEVWSATPLPSSLEAPFLVRHGAGYTVWQQASHGLEQELEAFVAKDDPVKLVRLRVANRSGRARRLTVTYFAPWVMGVDQSTSRLFVVPEFVAQQCALLATNRYNAEFGQQNAFLASNKAPHGVTTDRREFLGRLGNLRQPASLQRIGLSGLVQAGCDPCAALQLHLDLPEGSSEEVLFVMGQVQDRQRALDLADQYRDLGRLEQHRQAARAGWTELLDTVQVNTPDPALNLLTNRWLHYQTISARLWGRSAFYQSSGAFGFRDQLQDVLSVLYTAPDLARAQIVRAAAHQFEEGDVLHWWHPPSGRGVRTRITDDLLWLPYVTALYVEATGDTGVLDEQVPFIQGPVLGPGEQEHYDHWAQGRSGTVLEHCLKTLERGSTYGRNGLPLMGGGDWNDGMNRVGVNGKGESVWLAWFLIVSSRSFADLLRRTGHEEQAADLEQRADAYAAAAQEHAWDGDWYLRAFYDDGTPLGSHVNQECRIDSIAQSWALFALGDHERGRRALAKVDELLVRPEDGLIRLFSPAFDKTPRDPGYIKGYLPGVRENGGQYTHAAVWTAWAFTTLGQGNRAHQLYSLLAPINHGATPEGVKRYKVEPYVMAADVYSLEPHVGRGGWTWYTGSASWFYRLGLEAILGLHKVGDSLRFQPCLPSDWPGYEVTWRVGASTYKISVKSPGTEAAKVQSVTLDGQQRPDQSVPLVDDAADHQVVVQLA